jgi:hypothetical protein
MRIIQDADISVVNFVVGAGAFRPDRAGLRGNVFPGGRGPGSQLP